MGSRSVARTNWCLVVVLVLNHSNFCTDSNIMFQALELVQARHGN